MWQDQFWCFLRNELRNIPHFYINRHAPEGTTKDEKYRAIEKMLRFYLTVLSGVPLDCLIIKFPFKMISLVERVGSFIRCIKSSVAVCPIS